MRIIEKENKSRRRTVIYICILIALLPLLVAASYTWFSISRTPQVSQMDLYISSRPGLELAKSWDAPDEEWGQTLSSLEIVSESAPLRPVTWSQQRQSFLSVSYGADGRMTDTFEELTDEANANRTDGAGYYVVETFYARTGANCDVSLAKAVEMNGGENGAGTYVIGTPVWNGETLLHDDGGQGAETAVRMGLMITKIRPESDPLYGVSEFYIYEPNCDRHIDGSTGYTATPSVDGTEQLSENLICQSASEWTEAYPVQRQVTVKNLGEFTTDTKLFSVMVGEIFEIKLYIWLEGQDADCTNAIESAQILANIQFSTDYVSQGGLVDIPEE